MDKNNSSQVELERLKTWEYDAVFFELLQKEVFREVRPQPSTIAIQSAFMVLSFHIQQALFLRYEYNFRLTEIAGEMNISVNKVVQYIERAKSHFRRRLVPQYYEQPLRQFLSEEKSRSVLD